jgi:hypothetical protein
VKEAEGETVLSEDKHDIHSDEEIGVCRAATENLDTSEIEPEAQGWG